MRHVEGLIFDWGRTLYDPEAGAPFPDAPLVLDALAATYRRAIVSLVSGDDYRARVAARHDVLREHDLARHFAAILFGQSDKDRLYREALALLALTPAKVAVIDDRVIRGVAWGNRHGATTIWLRNGKFRDEVPSTQTGTPTHTICRLEELPGLLA